MLHGATPLSDFFSQKAKLSFMKITIIQGAFLPIPPVLGGGTEKMWYALAVDFARRGHEVVYISRTYPGLPKEEWLEGVLHKRVKGYDWPATIFLIKWLDFWYSLRARSVVPADSDVVVTNTFWAPLLLSSYLRKRCLVDVARMPKGQMKLYNSAGRLRANSSPVAKAIYNELPADQHRRVVMIPNPLPYQDLPGLDLCNKEALILYTGRLHPEKGLHLLIEAYKALHTDWQLKIVGPWEKAAGGGGEKYLQYLKSLAGSKNVEFTGAIHDTEQLNKYYAAASIFVYPSVAEKGETFGLSPLEAMSWGSVPIVSALDCFKDFITHQRNGLIFDHRSTEAVGLLKTALEELILNRDDRHQMAKAGLQVRKSHATSFISLQFLEAFEQIVQEQSLAKPILI